VRRLKHLKHLALDLDGTLYLGGRVFDFTKPFLARLAELGIGHTFFTNNSSRSSKQYVQHLTAMGIACDESGLYSSTHCTIEYLRERMPDARRLFILGTPALREEFAENGFVDCGEDANDAPDAVVVGFDTTLGYPRLSRCAWWISKGVAFIATHCDNVCPTDEPTVLPDCGAICKMLEHATGRAPDAVLGKPDPRMLGGMMRRHDLSPEQIGVVGDRLYTDIAMARTAGAMGILVLTGETTLEQARVAGPPPDVVVSDVGELASLLTAAREKNATC
jgi:HAD superfamily hydrolase (TIGR01450 family)